MNFCVLVGRLTKDPEMHYSENSEMSIARFTIAVDRGRKVEGESNADFFRCVAFDKKADFVEQYLFSGMRIVVQGKIRNENYTNKDGAKVYGVSILADQIEFADAKRDDGQAEQGQAATQAGNSRTAGGSQQSAVANRTAAPSSSGRSTGSRQSASRQTSGTTASGRSAGGRSAAGRQTTRRTEARPAARSAVRGDGFMNITDGVEDEGLPFN